MRTISPHDTSFDPVAPEYETPEYAGFLIRLVAYIIDWFILSVISGIFLVPVMILYFAVIFMGTSDNPNMMFMLMAMLLMMIIVLIMALVMILYFAWFESSKYMGTPGKILLKLKVADANGNRISLVTAFLRTILKNILNNFFWIGSLFILFSDKKQGIYDLLLNTYVIKDE